VTSYLVGESVAEKWQDTTMALGPAEGSTLKVVSLGRGGQMTLKFDPPIRDLPGDDFAIFENSFSHTFLELAFVEVSQDGVNFERFANDSVTTESSNRIIASDIDGFAGKYIVGKGTPFDLADLGLFEVSYVKLIDVIGGESLDSSGDVIFDPPATQISAGFDLDGIAVLNKEEPINILSREVVGDEFVISWETTPGARYEIEASTTLLENWESVFEKFAEGEVEIARFPIIAESARFFRLRRLMTMTP